MKDMIIVLAVLLVAGWLLGLNFYSTGTSIQIMSGFVAVVAAVGIIGQLRRQRETT